MTSSTNPASSAGLPVFAALVLLLGVCAALTSSSQVQAQATPQQEPAAPRDEDRALARILANQGFEALNGKQPATAEEKFDKAIRLYPAPTLFLGRGRARLQRGHWVAAAEDFRRAMHFREVEGESEVFQRARTEAGRRLQELEARIPTLTVTVAGGTPVGLAVNQQAWPVELVGEPRPMDPGRYQVTATGENRHTDMRTIELVAGQQVTVALRLPVLEPRAVAVSGGASPPAVAAAGGDPARAGQAPQSASPAALKDNEGPRGPVMAMGLVTAALAVGAVVTSILYVDKQGDFDEANRARAESRGDLRDDAQTMGVLNAALWGGTAMGAAVTGIMLLADTESPGLDERRAAPDLGRVALRVGLSF